MPANPAEFTFRHEELVPLAKLLREQYTRDKADFVDLLPDEYTDAFLTEYDRRLAAAGKLVSQLVRQGQAAAIGQRLKEKGEALPALLNRLEARARRVTGLTVPLKKLGLKEVRAAYASNDLENLDTALKDLLQNLTDNATALAAKGHTAAETTKIRQLHTALMADSAAQDATQTSNQRITAANITVLNQLYALMRELMQDGKSLYRGTDKAKLKSYTLRQLLKRVRQQRQEPEEGESEG
ncbi:hypothetical protein [Hymenobacter guriensis]|uniref:Uncharacterized protein n=1 Tax=Hymenobacter guriensis TaxID=2793065 RepID=A0ABS0KZK2_9BACT|nr:hypothetical protein [Hymenobacter guriensis]MBG8553300.1 hypothetical protein [Hymenobacter guriensis]